MHIIICKNWIYATQSKQISQSVCVIFYLWHYISCITIYGAVYIILLVNKNHMTLCVKKLFFGWYSNKCAWDCLSWHGLVIMVDMFWPTKYYYNNLQCHEHPPPPKKKKKKNLMPNKHTKIEILPGRTNELNLLLVLASTLYFRHLFKFLLFVAFYL